MLIVLDPLELKSVAVTMGAAAVELADVGSSLRSCTSCTMPFDIRSRVDQIVATLDVVLDSSAALLRTEGSDLAQRALIGTNDSVAAASLATTSTSPASINGHSTGSGGDPTMNALFERYEFHHARAQVIIDDLVRSGDPAAVTAGLQAQFQQGDAVTHFLAPSRTDLESNAGHSLTWSEIARISPDSVPFDLR